MLLGFFVVAVFSTAAHGAEVNCTFPNTTKSIDDCLSILDLTLLIKRTIHCHLNRKPEIVKVVDYKDGKCGLPTGYIMGPLCDIINVIRWSLYYEKWTVQPFLLFVSIAIYCELTKCALKRLKFLTANEQWDAAEMKAFTMIGKSAEWTNTVDTSIKTCVAKIGQDFCDEEGMLACLMSNLFKNSPDSAWMDDPECEKMKKLRGCDNFT